MKCDNIIFAGKIDFHKTITLAFTRLLLRFYGNSILIRERKSKGITYFLCVTKHRREILFEHKLSELLQSFLEKEFQTSVRSVTCCLVNIHYSCQFQYKNQALINEVIAQFHVLFDNVRYIIAQEQHAATDISFHDLETYTPQFMSIKLVLPNRNCIKFQNNTTSKEHTSATITCIHPGQQFEEVYSLCESLCDRNYYNNYDTIQHQHFCSQLARRNQAVGKYAEKTFRQVSHTAFFPLGKTTSTQYGSI